MAEFGISAGDLGDGDKGGDEDEDAPKPRRRKRRRKGGTDDDVAADAKERDLNRLKSQLRDLLSQPLLPKGFSRNFIA